MKISELMSMYEPQFSTFATHVSLLRALGKGISTVLELGGGEFSTPLFLDRKYYPYLAELVTVEQDRNWVKAEDDSRHKIVIGPEPIEPFLDTLNLDDFNLIFVDNSMLRERRCETLRYIGNRVRRSLVVVHDYEYPAYAANCFAFDHAIVDDRQEPWTALLWRTR